MKGIENIMKRINPFLEIYRQCNGLSNFEKYKALRDSEFAVPLYLDIELTNYCNMHCHMCPVGTGNMKREKGFMSDKIFMKILHNVMKYHIQGVRFIRWGEPTLHPNFLEWAGLLKQEGILVHFNTNGLLLNEAVMGEILNKEIDSIKFSFQGIDELTYEEMRGGVLAFIK